MVYILQVRSILDYDIDIHPLPIQEQTYTALNMNYSVAGFQVWQTFNAQIEVVCFFVRASLGKILLMLHRGSLNVQIDAAPNQNFAQAKIWQQMSF